MGTVIGLVFIFSVGAFAGWVLELFYRRVFSGKRWINPGFLNGPYLPLYGFSTIALYGISHLSLPFWGQVILFLAVPTLLELVTGLIFTSWYNIRLWDYSDQPLNYKGIICPLYTLFWGILGTGFDRFIYPVLSSRLDFLLSHLELSFFVGFFLGLFILDTIYSLDIAAQIRKVLTQTEERFHVNYERLKVEVRDWAFEHTNRRFHLRFMLPFSGKAHPGLRETMEKHLDRIRRGVNAAEKLPVIRRRRR